MVHWAVPDVVPYLLAVLGLLLIWQLHQIQVKAGRIKAADVLHRSNIRLFIHVTPEDGATCPSCRDANGRSFLAVAVTAKKFSPRKQPCSNPEGCRCVLVGLYGAWPEAQAVHSRLMAGMPVRLAHKELDHLIDGGKARRHGVESDRLSLAMLEATRAESWDVDLAIERYEDIVANAKADRDLAFVLPSYLRLCELLERSRRYRDALTAVDRFLRTYEPPPQGRPAATASQIEAMKLRRTRLTAVQR